MSEMIERVALAIRSGMEASGVATITPNGPKGEMGVQQFFEVLAKDAIKAMREPTDAIAAAHHVVPDDSNFDERARDNWRAMIDTALSGK